MKYIALCFYLWFCLHAQCHESLPEQQNHCQQSHLSSNPYATLNTQHCHNNDLQHLQHFYTQKNYYANDISATQKLSAIQKFMDYFSREPFSVSHASTPETIQPKITKPKPQQNKQNIPACINTTEQPIASTDPQFSEIKDQLFIQQQCSEWDRHEAIINTRIQAIDQAKNGNTSLLRYTIKQEFITITEQNTKVRNQYRSCKQLHKMTNTITDFTDAGIAYNNNNEAKNALLLADACWMILDCIQAVAEGLVDGALHIVDDIAHPVQTAQSIAESAAICGYYIGKIAIECGHLGYLTILEHPDTVHEKLNAWKHNFSLIYKTIQEKQSSVKAHDIIKETVSMGVQFYATTKLLHGLGRLFKQAHKQVIIFSQSISALKKTHAFTTPEGVVVRIADNAVEYMKNIQQPISNSFIPKFIQENRVPIDPETILKNIVFKKTKIPTVKGAQVYTKDNLFYHRDTLHRGKRAHLEVYNRKGLHLGEADPITGQLIPGTADKTKTLFK